MTSPVIVQLSCKPLSLRRGQPALGTEEAPITLLRDILEEPVIRETVIPSAPGSEKRGLY